MAIWVTPGTEKPQNIVGTAPRASAGEPMTDAQEQWRKFVLKVQRHDCFEPKCMFKNGKRLDSCRYGYPREIFTDEDIRRDDDGAPLLNDEGMSDQIMYKFGSQQEDRYVYRADLEEDQRLSPYVPLWLLATGASMNIQFCTTAGFLSYIAKYVCKAEPHQVICDSEALRERNEETSPQMRFLDARNVGAPEVVFRLFQYEMKHGGKVVHLCTKPPDLRQRCLAQVLDEDPNADPDELAMRFYDGSLEQYARRPESVPDIDFEAITYPDFHRRYEIKTFDKLTLPQLADGSWRCVTLPTEAEVEFTDDANGPHPKSRWVVARGKHVPVWWDWMLPSTHGDLYF
jgi:hypothetical protein